MNGLLLLQTLDGAPVTENEYPQCERCGSRLREGTEVIACAYLEQDWKVDRLYHTDCYLEVDIDLTRDTEEAVVEGRLAVRDDQALQRHYPVLHTKGGYGIFRRTGNLGNSDPTHKVSTGDKRERRSDGAKEEKR